MPYHLAVGEVQIIAHFHGQRAPAPTAEVHNAVLAATVRHVVDGEHSLAHRIPLRETRKGNEITNEGLGGLY